MSQLAVMSMTHNKWPRHCYATWVSSDIKLDSIPLLSINSVCISTDLARARHACMLSYLPGATEASNYSNDGG